MRLPASRRALSMNLSRLAAGLLRLLQRCRKGANALVVNKPKKKTRKAGPSNQCTVPLSCRAETCSASLCQCFFKTLKTTSRKSSIPPRCALALALHACPCLVDLRGLGVSPSNHKMLVALPERFFGHQDGQADVMHRLALRGRRYPRRLGHILDHPEILHHHLLPDGWR